MTGIDPRNPHSLDLEGACAARPIAIRREPYSRTRSHIM
jgi:hypothetical protein